MNHNWYAVLPANILLNKELSDKQKLLIALISNLSNERGYCFASNKYLGECLGCSESTIKDNIKTLEDKNILGRIIKLNDKKEVEFRSLVINLEMPDTPQPKNQPTPAEKLAHNNKEEYIYKSLYNDKEAFIKRVDDFKDKLGNQYDEFIAYWIEANAKGKMRYQEQKFFDMSRRIATWIKNSKNYKPIVQDKQKFNFK